MGQRPGSLQATNPTPTMISRLSSMRASLVRLEPERSAAVFSPRQVKSGDAECVSVGAHVREIEAAVRRSERRQLSLFSNQIRPPAMRLPTNAATIWDRPDALDPETAPAVASSARSPTV